VSTTRLYLFDCMIVPPKGAHLTENWADQGKPQQSLPIRGLFASDGGGYRVHFRLTELLSLTSQLQGRLELT